MKHESQRKKGSCVKEKDFRRLLQAVSSDRWKLCDQTVVGRCCLRFLASCPYPAMVGCDSLNKITLSDHGHIQDPAC
jgi:hypothetical protein